MAIRPLPPPLHAPATEREGVVTRPWAEFYNMLHRYQVDHDALVLTVSAGGGGAGGTIIYSGSGAPAGGLGVDDDYYFNTTNGDWYQKDSGAWGSPIANLSGADGSDGDAGADGTDGTDGQGVPTGGTTGQVLAKASATDYDTEWVAASTPNPIIILSKSSTVNQNIGGANTTETWLTWDGEIKKDTGFTHSTSTNSERVTVAYAGWYELNFVVHGMQTGANRTTLLGIYRINGGTTLFRGSFNSYSRGNAYGNCTVGVRCIIELSASDYVEVGSIVDDTDATYTINTSGTEIAEDSHTFSLRKIA